MSELVRNNLGKRHLYIAHIINNLKRVGVVVLEIIPRVYLNVPYIHLLISFELGKLLVHFLVKFTTRFMKNVV